MRSLASILAFAVVVLSACAARRDLTVAQIATVTKLDDLMDVQATVADPQWSKMTTSGYTDADWAALADVATRIQATSARIKDFSKGPAMDELGAKLHTHAEELGKATAVKDETGAKAALTAMKATCKECHRAFR